jgi:hypothetical protein
MTKAMVSANVDPAKIPAVYQVSVSPALTIPEMVDHVDAIRNLCMDIHAQMTDEPEPKDATYLPKAWRQNMKAVATYSNIADDCIRLRAQILGGSLRDQSYKALSPEESEKARREWATLLAGNLTKLRHGKAFGDTHGYADMMNGGMHFWAQEELPKLANACISLMRHWAQLKIWEAKEGDVPDDYWNDIQKKLRAKKRRREGQAISA